MNNYRLVFGIRFLGYFLFFTGLISFVFMLGPLVQAEVKYRTDKILGIIRTVKTPIQIAQTTEESSASASLAACSARSER